MPHYFSQPLTTGARVMVNRPRHGDDLLFEIYRCSSATKAEEIAQALNATDAIESERDALTRQPCTGSVASWPPPLAGMGPNPSRPALKYITKA